MNTGPENLNISQVQDPQHPIPDSAVEVPTALEKDTPQALSEGRTIGQDNNPAEAPPLAETLEAAEKRMTALRGTRVDLTSVDRKLDVPRIEGYSLYWFLESNVPRALQAWYEFVDPKEVPTHDRSIGGRGPRTNTEDLGGSRVSQIGGTGEDGRPVQLVLMKIRLEWFHQSQKKLAARNRQIIHQMFGARKPIRAPEETEADFGMRYMRETAFNMSNGRFRKKADSGAS